MCDWQNEDNNLAGHDAWNNAEFVQCVTATQIELTSTEEEEDLMQKRCESQAVPIVQTFFLLIIDINPSEIEDEPTVWSAHPSEQPSLTQIYLEEGYSINTGLTIYIGGSRTEKKTVFQSELLALLKAVEHAVKLRTQQLTIPVANQDSIQSAAKPKSHDTITRKIFELLHSHSHIRVSWIRARVGYLGNAEEDRLAKGGIRNGKIA
ncbi:hypothetical protein AVEN_170992-1 [Araneus ventricosus]|uniref:RNase H type-1 domain-containing protein n=1 Tax=Araneus ventricosus TaxID=182803 RepID=A0A4Y2GHE9_ARAVE|nr:hypothetical protein AVEN_170992-1 [Araneus ventricosus]